MSQTLQEFLKTNLPQADTSKLADSFLIAYFSDRVCIGQWRDNEPVLQEALVDWSKLVQLHIFNEQEEVRCIKRHEGRWLMRHREDSGKDDFWDCYDEDLLIIGNDPGKAPKPGKEPAGFVTLDEDGRIITLPPEALGKRIRVRNYLEDVTFEEFSGSGDYEQTAQSEEGTNQDPPLSALRVCDYRFVGFYDFADSRGENLT